MIGQDIALKLLNAREDDYEPVLQNCFKQLMTCPPEKVTEETKKLLKTFSRKGTSYFRSSNKSPNRILFILDKCCDKNLASLFNRLNLDFPNDIGCFAIYFLNYIILQPLEAMYLGANEPHAYLFGGFIIKFVKKNILYKNLIFRLYRMHGFFR